MFATCTLPCSFALVLSVLCPPAAAQGQRFRIDQVSVLPGQTWALNREIVFDFNEPLDFSTVNPNTVQLATNGGVPALGSFSLRAPDQLVFQPSCPSQSDLSDSGLAPGSIYVLQVPDATTAQVTLLAQSGKRLAQGALVSFQTPDASSPLNVLFDDELPGPPQILVQPTDVDGSLLETGAGERQLFQLGANGIATLPGFLAPLNLQSDAQSSITLLVRMNQALLPFESNINASRIHLEYRDLANAWHTLATEVSLLDNCSGAGATLRLRTDGVLPQARALRVWIGAGLQDISGDPTSLVQDFLQFESDAFRDAAGLPRDHADERFVGFELGAPASSSLEDGEVLLEHPSALWGEGRLSASTGFVGTGGSGGDFDLHVPPGTTLIIDTVQTIIFGGPGGLPVNSQVVLGGVLDIRNLVIPASSELVFQGPNPATILASGTITLDGKLSVNGFNAASVFTLNNPTQPEPGAPGNCGGGSGGIGSFETTAVTQRGGSGNGAFGVPTGGGEGGESGYSSSSANSGVQRRAAGGGGGRFGHDQKVLWQHVDLCLDQANIGLDAESGFPGHDLATSSQGPHIPYGGHAGETPFQGTLSLRDDFLGRAILDFRGASAAAIHGELSQAWAGAGGGAGGDATRLNAGESYPPSTLTNANQDKGAGGGGGAGSISIFALGDVSFGPLGKLTARGGHGNGGENTSSINRIGGGSGGGSGGHIILHTAGLLDLSGVTPGSYAIDARGGQGGDGANGQGGAFVGESSNAEDARHSGANNGTDNPWEFLSASCTAYLQSIGLVNQVTRAAGGDGGPGVVQLHVGELSGASATHSIRYPGAGLEEELGSVIQPVPVGYNPFRHRWQDHLLPDISARSQAQSEWIALGHPQVTPGSNAPDLLEVLFAGTDPATGLVLETNGQVDLLPAILAPVNPLEAPGLPNVAGTRTIYFDAAGLSGAAQIYRDNPALLRGFQLQIGVSPAAQTIEGAALLPRGPLEVLAVRVADPLPLTTGLVSLHPSSFLSMNGLLPNQVPAGATIRIEFQAAGEDAVGQPDSGAIYPGAGAWASAPALLSGHSANANFRFVRLRVTFDIGTATTGPGPLPSLEFMKWPVRF